MKFSRKIIVQPISVAMTIEMSSLIHKECPNVNHDIGIKLAEIVAKYEHNSPWDGLIELIVNHLNISITNHTDYFLETLKIEGIKEWVWRKLSIIVNELQFNSENLRGMIRVEIHHMINDEFDFVIQDTDGHDHVTSTLGIIQLRNTYFNPT